MKGKKRSPKSPSRNLAETTRKIMELDLAPAKCGVAIKFGWPRRRIETAAAEYRDFLLLIASEKEELCVPSADADCIWHEMVLRTNKYASDCRRIFGRLLHHDDFAGAWGSDDLREQRERFRRSQHAIVELKSKWKC